MGFEILELWDGRTIKVHEEGKCTGDVCPIHDPSDHPYRSWGHGWNGKHMLRVGQYGVRRIDPDDYEFNRTGRAIIRNSAFCKVCGIEVESRSVHDFRSCECGNVFVDGGAEYLRHGWTSREDYVDTSVVVTKKDEDYDRS